MTHPHILEAERNGMPNQEPEVVECPSCGRYTYPANLRKCEKCKQEICVSCPDARWIPEYGWHLCGTECAIAYLVEKIQDQDDELFELRKKVRPRRCGCGYSEKGE